MPSRRLKPERPDIPIPTTIGEPEIEKAAGAYRELRDRHRAALTAGRELADKRAAAEEEDRRALAGAYKAGEKDPGQRKLAAAVKAVDDAQRNLEALAIAVDEANRDLIDAIRSPAGNEVLDAATRDEVKALDAEAKALDDLEAAVQLRAEAKARRRWILSARDRSGPVVYSPSAGFNLDLPHPNGDGHPLPSVIAALREYADPARQSTQGGLPRMPVPPGGPAQPLQPVRR